MQRFSFSHFFFFFFLFVIATQWGCVSGAPMRSPRIAPKGKFQLNVTPNVLTATIPNSTSGTPSPNDPVILPALDIAMFYGITDFLDIQVHVNTFGYITAGVGFQLVRSKYFDLSTSLDIGGVFFGFPGIAFGYLTFPLNIWAGINLHKHFGINLSAGYQGYFFFAGLGGGGATALAHAFVSSLAFDIRLNDYITLRPQGSVTVPLMTGGFVTALLWTAGVGLIFTFGGGGGDKKKTEG